MSNGFTTSDIETNYTNYEHGFSRKVLAGSNWSIRQTATNQLTVGQPITNINITILAQNVTWNGTEDEFLLIYLNQTGDFDNVTGNGTSTYNWSWTPNGGTLAPSQSANITYVVTAPNNVPTSGTYMAVRELLSYQIFYLASNLSLDNITGKSTLDFNVRKENY